MNLCKMVTESTPLLKQCIVTIPRKCSEDDNFAITKGLTLEELLPFVDDPWWRHARRICLITLWITFIAIFTAACSLSILEHGTCPASNGVKSNRTTIISVIGMANDS